MTHVKLPLIAVAMVLVFSQSSPTCTADEPDPIIGKWKAVSLTGGGGKKLEMSAGTFTIDKDKITRSTEDMNEVVAIQLDPMKSPQQIDITITGPDGSQHLLPGIYKVEGDTLTLCVVDMDLFAARIENDRKTGDPQQPAIAPADKVKAARPIGFDSKMGILAVLKRVQE